MSQASKMRGVETEMERKGQSGERVHHASGKSPATCSLYAEPSLPHAQMSLHQP